MSSLADGYGSYADLASAQAEGTDYRVHVRPFAGSSIAVIAPHGGGIEALAGAPAWVGGGGVSMRWGALA